MSFTEVDEKTILPVSITCTRTPPTCCSEEISKGKNSHTNNLVEEQQKNEVHQEKPKRNQKLILVRAAAGLCSIWEHGVQGMRPWSIHHSASTDTANHIFVVAQLANSLTEMWMHTVILDRTGQAKLVRSTAVCDETLPNESINKMSEDEIVSTANNMAYSDCEEKQKEKPNEHISPKKSLSKETSLEYTDSTGIDLEEFLITTLKSSPRDRLMLLKLEQDMTDFMTDNSSYKKFPQMSSYHRMLVHRVAAFFGLEHNVDHSGKAIIINKTSNSRIPAQRFAEHVQEEKAEEMRSILKRESSQEKEGSQSRTPRLKDQMKTKSFEEREEEYQRARERIFSQDVAGPVQSVYIETRGPDDCCNVHSEAQRKRQIFRGNRNSSSQFPSSAHSSMESNWSEPRPWSSTDSETSSWSSKPTLTHSDSNPKLYKPVAVPVASESSIPPGSILLNPLTGQPYRNPDGTPAVYNPPGSQQLMNTQLNTMQPQASLPTHQQQASSHCLPHYSSVTYAPPQQVIPVSPQLYPLDQSGDDFLPQFGQMTLNHQPSGDPSDLPTYYGSTPTHSYMQPQHNFTSYYTADTYMNTGMAPTPLSAQPPCTQQNTQVSMFSFPDQCANTAQQYGQSSYITQAGYAYPSMVGTQVLQPTQKSIMGACPSTSSYQVAPHMQSSYPSPVLVSRQAGQNQSAVSPAGVTVYCNPLSSSTSPLNATCQSGSCRSTCNVNQNQCWY